MMIDEMKMNMDEKMNGKMMETWNGKMKNEDEWENIGTMIDDMVEMGDEWKIWWWKMMEHEMDMMDDIWCGEIEATNLASCLLTTIMTMLI